MTDTQAPATPATDPEQELNEERSKMIRKSILEHASKIVDGVIKKAEEGHFQSAKFLFGLIGFVPASDEDDDPFAALLASVERAAANAPDQDDDDFDDPAELEEEAETADVAA